MKNLKLILISALLLLAAGLQAQNSSKWSVAIVKSNIVCGMCEDNLNDMFKDFYAVREVDYDIENQEIILTYNSKKTDISQIEDKVIGVGYQANEKLPLPEVRETLPLCCQGEFCAVQESKKKE